jgi:hypothetical protein
MIAELLADRDIAPGPTPVEVLSYWRAKKLRIGFSHLDVWREEHDFAFTAAKIMREDVLAAMRDELDRAFTQGIPFPEFVRSVEPRMKALGWWDKHEVTDPKTGNVVEINPPQRLHTIYQTNMRTARAVGQWDRLQRNKDTRPYLLYQVGPSARHREQHLAWHGLLLSADDPFWSFAFPPNGWGCLPDGELVRTPRGWQRIDALAAGDLVLNGAGEPQPVRMTHSRAYHGQIVRLVGEWGQTDATPNHRFLTCRGWLRADCLKPGDILVQLPKVAALNPNVREIHETNAALRDLRMSLPWHRDASLSKALDAELERGDVDVDPLTIDMMVMHGLVASAREHVEHDLLASRRRRARVDVMLWPQGELGQAHLGTHLGTTKRGAGAQLLGAGAYACARLLGFAESWMPVLAQALERSLASGDALLRTSLGVVGPLQAYSLAHAARAYLEVPQQPHDRSVVEIPALAQHANRHELLDVEEPQGFVSGAPLDRFDVLDDFAAWAGGHCELLTLDSVVVAQYTGNVNNLTVEGGSYVSRAGITHNCKCSARTVSPREYKTLQREGVLGPNPEPELDDEGLPTGHVKDVRVDVRIKAPVVPLVPWENKRTGKVELVRQGIDPGFDKLPGAGRRAALKP